MKGLKFGIALTTLLLAGLLSHAQTAHIGNVALLPQPAIGCSFATGEKLMLPGLKTESTPLLETSGLMQNNIPSCNFATGNLQQLESLWGIKPYQKAFTELQPLGNLRCDFATGPVSKDEQSTEKAQLKFLTDYFQNLLKIQQNK